MAKNPDVKTYVRRTGAENGLFATQTSRGDIQVVLRPAEEDPVSLVIKPVRPELSARMPEFDNQKLEDKIKQWGKEAAEKKYGAKFTEADAPTREQMTWEEGKAVVRQEYRRRPLRGVMAEVE